jgi:hypothetical protein
MQTCCLPVIGQKVPVVKNKVKYNLDLPYFFIFAFMRKIFAFGILAAVLIFTNSCKNDLDSLAPYVESVAVYGLIDQNDTANYIRVNRVFLGQGNANEIAQIKDSAYFKPDEVSVVVEKYFNGIKKQTYVFAETYEIPLQPGTFNTEQLIYKSTAQFKADSAGKSFEYHLIVTNNKSGKQYTATTKLVGTSSLCAGGLGQNCFFNQSIVSILPSTFAQTNVKFIAPANVGLCGVATHFYYQTVFNDNTQISRSMDFDLGNQKTSSTNGGETMDFSFKGASFYSVLASNIQAESNLKERVMDSMSFVFKFAGTEYSLYREINNTTGSFGQDKPIYTNISNGGVGVFSSRTSITVTKKMYDCTGGTSQANVLSDATRNALTTDPRVCSLRFRGPNCLVNPGC